MFLNENTTVTNNDNELFSEDSEVLITEAVLAEEGVELTEDELNLLESEGLLSEKSIVRLDKFAKRKLAVKKAAIVLAKEKKDPMYRKLVIVYKAKQKLIAAIMKKYSNQALIRVKKRKANPTVNKVLKSSLKRVNTVTHIGK